MRKAHALGLVKLQATDEEASKVVPPLPAAPHRQSCRAQFLTPKARGRDYPLNRCPLALRAHNSEKFLDLPLFSWNANQKMSGSVWKDRHFLKAENLINIVATISARALSSVV